MLNTFPGLLVYSMLAPTIIRVILGLTFLNTGILKLKRENARWQRSLEILRIPNTKVATRILGLIEFIGGMCLILGLQTQVSSLILALLALISAFIEYKDPNILRRNFSFYILILAMATSLLFSGAGFLAFDIPL